ncbi:hypothetical protein ACWGN9_09685 [Streptomyces sp. NPDC055775]
MLSMTASRARPDGRVAVGAQDDTVGRGGAVHGVHDSAHSAVGVTGLPLCSIMEERTDWIKGR